MAYFNIALIMIVMSVMLGLTLVGATLSKGNEKLFITTGGSAAAIFLLVTSWLV